MWLKHLTVDLLATLVIAVVVFYETALLEYVLYIYTGLMVIARSASFYRIDIRAVTRNKINEAPVWVYHLLYFINVVLLIIGEFYFTSLSWFYIWIAAMFVYYKKEGNTESF